MTSARPTRLVDLGPLGNRLPVDGVLGLPQEEYDLHARHHLYEKDILALDTWLPTSSTLFDALVRLRRQPIVRRKELYETLFVMERLADELARERAVIEIGAGHGLFGLFSALLHPNLRQVLLIDRRIPLSYGRAREVLAAAYPWVKTRTAYARWPLSWLHALPRGAFIVGVHCCGGLTDHLARLARSADASFAVVPCCEGRKLLPAHIPNRQDIPGDDIPDIVNAHRIERWRGWGYDVEERRIPTRVTERPRILIARR